MKEKEEFEKFLKYLKESTSIIVVEGREDRVALVDLGVENERIRSLNKPLYAIVEEVIKLGKGCIILTDLDKKGKELYAKLNDEFSRTGVMVDNWPREFLFKTRLRQIEGMKRYLERL